MNAATRPADGTGADLVTYRHPRSLEQAFGPHTSQRIEPKPEVMHPHDRIVLRFCAVAAAGLLAMFALGWLP